MKNREYWAKWAKAAGVRAVRTMAQTIIATAGASATMGEVNWTMAVSAMTLAGILSVATSFAGLPELKVPKMEEQS